MPILKPLSRRAAIAAASVGTGLCYSFHSYRKYNSPFECRYRTYLSNCEKTGKEPVSKDIYRTHHWDHGSSSSNMLEAAHLGGYWAAESCGGGRGGYGGM